MATTLSELSAQNFNQFTIDNDNSNPRIPIVIPDKGERLCSTGETASFNVLLHHEDPYDDLLNSTEYYLVAPDIARRFPGLVTPVKLHLASSRYRGTILIPEFLDSKCSRPWNDSLGIILSVYAGKNIFLEEADHRPGYTAKLASNWLFSLSTRLTLADAVHSAFKDRIIRSEDHPVLQTWMHL